METPRSIPLRPSKASSEGMYSTQLNPTSLTGTHNMETLTIALTLEPGSVAEHPAYRILYKDNRPALRAFITHAKSITYEEAGANSDFCKAILEDEKGDEVSYTVINVNLTKLRMTAASTPKMASILSAYDKLIRIRDQWLEAGIRYFSFDCWYSMVRGYFIKNDDPELLALLKEAPGHALENFFHFRSEFSDPISQMGYKSDLNELRTAYIQRHRDLMSQKRQMQRELGSFQSIHGEIDDHLKRLSNYREAEEKKQKEKIARRAQLKERTLNNAIQQMGQLGSEPLLGEVQDALDDMHEALYEEHFEVKEDDEDPDERKRQEEWQKEVLSRPYNMTEHERKRMKTYTIRFGDNADDEQSMGSRYQVREDKAATTTQLDHETEVMVEQVDLETLAPASILDRDALAWMALHYGQRKVGGIRDLWRSLFQDQPGPGWRLQKKPPRSESVMRERSRSRTPS